MKRMFLAFFDFDSTLIEQEIIDELAHAVGKKEEVSRLTRETMEGKHTYPESLKKRTAALAGLSLNEIERVAHGITFRHRFDVLGKWLHDHQFKTSIITGSFDNVLSLLDGTRFFDYLFTNHLEEFNGKLTGNVHARVIDNKGELARNLKQQLNIPTERCVAVGDGSTDIPVFEQCGFSIALNAKSIVRTAATVACDTNDLSDLIPHLEAWHSSASLVSSS